MDSISYGILQHELERLQRQYPWSVQCEAGFSVLGQPLHLFRTGSGKTHLLVHAAMHANEWLTSFALLRVLERYSSALVGCERELAELEWLQSCSIWAVPLVNPDGVQLVMDGADEFSATLRSQLLAWNGGNRNFAGWKANIRGVDLNDQFPAGWEQEQARRSGQAPGPGPRDYVGVAPLVEPEALALAELTERVQFAAVLALHSQGEEIYYNYRNLEPDVSLTLAQSMASASGFRAVALQDSDAGFKDWFIGQFRRPGFTIELGNGHNPLPWKDLPVITEQLAAILSTCLQFFSRGER
jgi:g-D-glutamyl-meso-diaminopimelate peptidase